MGTPKHVQFKATVHGQSKGAGFALCSEETSLGAQQWSSSEGRNKEGLMMGAGLRSLIWRKQEPMLY